MNYDEFVAVMAEGDAELHRCRDDGVEEWSGDFMGRVCIVGEWNPLTQSAFFPTL